MKKTPLQLIKAACLEGGSSFEEDRKPLPIKGSTHNVPIPINPECNIFAFPTQSPSAFQCNWIFYNHVKSIKPSETRTEVTSKSIILFRNEHLFPMNVSNYTLQNKYKEPQFVFFSSLNKFTRYQDSRRQPKPVSPGLPHKNSEWRNQYEQTTN